MLESDGRDDFEGLEELSELLEDDEPTKRVQPPRLPPEALRPPRMPRESVMLPPKAPDVREHVAMHLFEQLDKLNTRVKRVEKRLLWLALAIVFAQKLDLAQLVELAKAMAAAP
jgi:hypothetical protein